MLFNTYSAAVSFCMIAFGYLRIVKRKSRLFFIKRSKVNTAAVFLCVISGNNNIFGVYNGLSRNIHTAAVIFFGMIVFKFGVLVNSSCSGVCIKTAAVVCGAIFKRAAVYVNYSAESINTAAPFGAALRNSAVCN